MQPVDNISQGRPFGFGLENGAVILLNQGASEIALHGVAEDNRRDTAVLSVPVLKLALPHLVVSQFWSWCY